ncbi:UNVERIFIED_CONTAM: hypothetical protein N8J90_11740 [Halobacillus marinus]
MESIRVRNKIKMNATDLLGVVVAALFIPKVSFKDISLLEASALGVCFLWLTFIIIKAVLLLRRNK